MIIPGDEDQVSITAIWKSAPKAARTTHCQIEALSGGKLSVLFLGGKSYRLEIPVPK